METVSQLFTLSEDVMRENGLVKSKDTELEWIVSG